MMFGGLVSLALPTILHRRCFVVHLTDLAEHRVEWL